MSSIVEYVFTNIAKRLELGGGGGGGLSGLKSSPRLLFDIVFRSVLQRYPVH